MRPADPGDADHPSGRVPHRQLGAGVPLGTAVGTADEPDLIDDRLAGRHHPLVLGHVLPGQERWVEVVVPLAEHAGGRRAAVKLPLGPVDRPEPVVGVFDEQKHVRQPVEQSDERGDERLGGHAAKVP